MTPKQYEEQSGMQESTDQTESLKGNHSYNLSLPQDHQQTSTMDLKGSTTYYMAHDTESLSQLLQAAAQGSPHSAGTLRLSYYRMETGSVTWLLKNQTAELP